ncbi:MAG: mechanosensitive ion channel family protein [Chloroflexi bacterium]|nr:mechanosensitive ion channel family protein [Chloroflexota bacterium]
MDGFSLSLDSEQLINLGISLALIVIATTLGRWVVQLVLGRLASRVVGKTDTTLDDNVLSAIRPIAYWFLVIFVTDLALSRLTFIPEGTANTLDSIFFALYLFAGFILAWRLINGLFDWYSSELRRTVEVDLVEQLLPFFRRIVLFIVAAIALSTLLSRFGVDVSGLIATLGITSLAVALAAQAALEDTISGLLIMLDRPYRIGDRIDILDLQTWGDVEDIGLRSSRIRTLDNRMVIIPNSVIGKSLVVNNTYPDHNYRMESVVGVAYGTDIEQARQVIVDAVKGCKSIEQDRPVDALLMEFGDSSLNIRARWWVSVPFDVEVMQDEVNTAIYKALNAHQIEIPFPQRDLNHKFDPQQTAILAQGLRGPENGSNQSPA